MTKVEDVYKCGNCGKIYHLKSKAEECCASLTCCKCGERTKAINKAIAKFDGGYYHPNCLLRELKERIDNECEGIKDCKLSIKGFKEAFKEDINDELDEIKEYNRTINKLKKEIKKLSKDFPSEIVVEEL